ncbi:MAG: nucleoside hydrolase [Bacteroidota bacterium]
MRHILIDTDTASDDAVALIMALQYPDVKVEAITVVAGNVPVEMGIQNALYTCELCGVNVPVYRGAAKPLMRELETAQFVHGQDGMGDIGLDLQGRKEREGNAIDVIVDTIHKFEGELEIITLAPLTNIALAILKDPSIVDKVKQCTIMGGIGEGVGNITPVSEFNIWVDPEAAKIVFESGMKMRMVGWDISRKYATFNEEDSKKLRAIGTKLAHFTVDIQKTLIEFAISVSQLAGFDLPDPIATAVALDPSLATRLEKHHVEVICHEGSTRGQTVVDRRDITKKPKNMEVVLEASREKFLEMLYQSLAD